MPTFWLRNIKKGKLFQSITIASLDQAEERSIKTLYFEEKVKVMELLYNLQF